MRRDGNRQCSAGTRHILLQEESRPCNADPPQNTRNEPQFAISKMQSTKLTVEPNVSIAGRKWRLGACASA